LYRSRFVVFPARGTLAPHSRRACGTSRLKSKRYCTYELHSQNCTRIAAACRGMQAAAELPHAKHPWHQRASPTPPLAQSLLTAPLHCVRRQLPFLKRTKTRSAVRLQQGQPAQRRLREASMHQAHTTGSRSFVASLYCSIGARPLTQACVTPSIMHPRGGQPSHRARNQGRLAQAGAKTLCASTALPCAGRRQEEAPCRCCPPAAHSLRCSGQCARWQSTPQ
jgi:hypothetical protein